MFSVLILTKNEEKNLPDCLKSVDWCDDVVILDSFSSDKTIAIAKNGGVRVFNRKFDDFGMQRNFALDEIPFRHPWVFHLDADERFNETLREECEGVISKDRYSAVFVPNRIIFLGKWIRHCTLYPYPQVRFLKIGEIRFAKSGHGQREDQALRGIGYIKTPYDHYNFSKGLSDWVDKHNRYSTEEAQSLLKVAGEPFNWRNLFLGEKIIQRRSMKILHAKLPLRWLVKFFYLYLVKRGFLDGYPGFAYCALQGFYDLLITVKLQEFRKSSTNRLQSEKD